MSFGITFGMIGGALLVLMVIAVWRGRRRRARESELPPLVFPLRRAPAVSAEPGPLGFEPPRPAAQNGSTGGPASTPAAADRVAGEWVVGAPRHSDSTLQLLPGRLERIGDAGANVEIRFVRAQGDGVPEFTLGRSDGPAHSHVRLDAPTVSRLHARMRFEQGRWRIMNLSSTNPLAVNGEALVSGGDAAELTDGDEVRLGELIFRFRGGAL